MAYELRSTALSLKRGLDWPEILPNWNDETSLPTERLSNWSRGVQLFSIPVTLCERSGNEAIPL